MSTGPSGPGGPASPARPSAPAPESARGVHFASTTESAGVHGAPFASTTEPVGGRAASSAPGPAYPQVRTGVPAGVVALVAAGAGALGLVAGLTIAGGPGRVLGTDEGDSAALAPRLAVAPAPAGGAATGAAGAAEETVRSGGAAAADETVRSGGAAAADGTATGAKTPAVLASDEGGRANPFPIGTTVTTEDWRVTLGAPREAGEEVQAENQFNEAPPAGMEYWIVPVRATYTGDETGHAGQDLRVGFVGDARTYSDMCGVVPDDLWDVDEVYDGGTAAGNVCVVVPAGADGLWTLTPGWSAEAVFFTGR